MILLRYRFRINCQKLVAYKVNSKRRGDLVSLQYYFSWCLLDCCSPFMSTCKNTEFVQPAAAASRPVSWHTPPGLLSHVQVGVLKCSTERPESVDRGLVSGVKWGEDYRLDQLRCSECRTCRFDNVCLNHSSLEIVFYKGSQDVIYYHEQTGKAQYDFPDDFLMLGICAWSACRLMQ